ncbi:MAG: OsmC family protein [Planctomycetota bacterium]
MDKEITFELNWQGEDAESFLSGKYSRVHEWQFDGGARVAASSSPHVVPLPMSDASCVDPEEAFVASLSSCHMLWFLAIAAKHGFVVLQYQDACGGKMGRDENNKLIVTRVLLRPQVDWCPDHTPSQEEIEQLHERAHQECFIANSVKTEVVVESR